MSRTVTVYSFRMFSKTPGDWIQAPHKAARETIEQLGGVVLEGTGEEVEIASLDDEGLFRRIATGWGELG